MFKNTTSISEKHSEDTVLHSDEVVVVNSLRGKEIWYYNMLNSFFLECSLEFIQQMISIINGEYNSISLRFLDWFVTRYCYLYKTSVQVKTNINTTICLNIHMSYKGQLRSYTKHHFDPFKRKKKFIYTHEKYKLSFLTTIGQLNFFRWLKTNDIISYTEANYANIISKYDHVNSFFKKNKSNSSICSDDKLTKSSADATSTGSSVTRVTRNISIYI